MTTDLDRLLELYQIKSQTIDIGDNQLTFMEEREYQSLKSQIESKLAQLEELKNGKHLKEYVIQKDPDIEQELSQLRPIVQALRDEFEKNEVRLVETGNAQYYNKVKSILESKNAV